MIMTTIMMTIMMTTTIEVTTMTERIQRSKPAVAAKVMVTGASLTSVLAMTAAMGSAAANESPDEPSTTVAGVDLVTLSASINVASVPVGIQLEALGGMRPEFFAQAPLSAPVVGKVADVSASVATNTPTTPAIAAPTAPAAPPVPSAAPTAPPAPVAAPTPIIVQVPTPAPAPSASTSKSK
jgi:hypothetical protein